MLLYVPSTLQPSQISGQESGFGGLASSVEDFDQLPTALDAIPLFHGFEQEYGRQVSGCEVPGELDPRYR